LLSDLFLLNYWIFDIFIVLEQSSCWFNFNFELRDKLFIIYLKTVLFLFDILWGRGSIDDDLFYVLNYLGTENYKKELAPEVCHEFYAVEWWFKLNKEVLFGNYLFLLMFYIKEASFGWAI
jgi:hypothetical protein